MSPPRRRRALVALTIFAAPRSGLAQLPTLPPVIRVDGQQWRIRNEAATSSFWAVQEVEFHAAPACTDAKRGAPIASSSVGNSTSGSHDASLAFDGVARRGLESAWWADCGGAGCGALEQWIGQDYEWSEYQMMCVRVFQAEEPGHFATAIALDRWNGTGWANEQRFPGTYGGYFMDLSVPALAKWRLLPLVAASGGWSVAELSLHTDVACLGVSGVATGASDRLGNGEDAPEASPEAAIDGNTSSAWPALCGGGPCEAMGPWLELRLAVPDVVRCLRILQVAWVGAGALQLQAWTGSEYENATTFVDLTPGVWDHMVRWEVVGRGAGSMWRLLPDEALRGAWAVVDFELFSDVACTGRVPVSSAIASGASGAAGPALAVDGDVATAWIGQRSAPPSGREWSGRNDGAQDTEHSQEIAWVGAATAAGAVVRCMRLLQGHAWENATSSLVVQVWNSTAWEDYGDDDGVYGRVDLRFHALASDVFFRGPPTWLRLPAVDRILWRLSQHNTLFQHWAVKEMRFYQGVDCTAAVPGEALGSGEVPAAPANPARNAFDGELSTEWWSTCSTCIRGEAWIGIAAATPRNVRCVSLFQSGRSPSGGREPWWASGVDLSKWNGHQWVKLAEFKSLSQGSWDLMHLFTHLPSAADAGSGLSGWSTPANTMWRVLHGLPMLRRWALASLTFYEDVECRRPVNGSVLASGETIDFLAAAASNDNATSEWLSSCEDCAANQAWLGLLFPQPVLVRCVRLFQTVTPMRGSPAVSVERFDGAAWARTAQAADLQPAAWEYLRVPPFAEANRSMWRVANAAQVRGAWRLTELRLFAGSSCSGPLSGDAVASGYKPGAGPELAFDGDAATFWESSCDGCPLLRAWLGVALPRGAPLVGCVQLRQERSTEHGASSVVLQLLQGDVWNDVLRIDDASLGAWDHLHVNTLPAGLGVEGAVGARRMWRLAPTVPVGRSWVVQHLAFFAAAGRTRCEGRLQGEPVSSGEADGYPATNAMPSSPADAEWRSSCIECAAGAAWIGAVFDEATDVGCVEFEQPPDALDAATAAALEFWDGTAWARVHAFDALSGGSRLTLTAAWERPADSQRYRLVNTEAVDERWRIVELTLYAGVECAMEVHGSPISPASEGAAMPLRAFDFDAATAWEAGGVPPFPAGSAWLGSHFETPVDVKCAVLRQGDAPGTWSAGVALETVANGAWSRMAELTRLSPGGWFALSSLSSAAHDVFVNFQSLDADVPAGYVADTGGLFGTKAAFGEWGDSLEYGWSCELQGVHRRYHFDQISDTAVETTCSQPVWELGTLAGRYFLRITYSNPGQGVETSGCLAEGRSASIGTVGPYERATRDMTADVADALLSFDATSGCDSISAMEVFSLPSRLTMWRISNGAAVAGRWHVHEMQFHPTDACNEDLIDGQQPWLFASGYADGAGPRSAADGDRATAWASSCEDCAPGGAWVAAAFASLQVVQCLKLFQSVELDRQTEVVVLERWNATAWEEAEVFRDTVGGLWAQYNSRWVRPPAGHRWRLAVANGTSLSGALRVAEATFYADAFCSEDLTGFAIASKTRTSAPSVGAFDGNFSTEYASACGPCVGSEAWIGSHFDAPVEVLCAAAALGSGTGVARRLAEQGLAERVPLRLEAWDGEAWAERGGGELLARVDGVAYLRRLADVGAESLRAGQAWRMVNAANTTAPWRIQEMSFFMQSTCEGQVVGTPISSSEKPHNPARSAFDGDHSYITAWVAACPSSGCLANSEWLGSVFNATHALQCVRIYQSSRTMAGDPAAAMIRLERWTEERRWETVLTFGSLQPVASGRWATLQLLTEEQKFEAKANDWRVAADGAVVRHWAIAEMSMYGDIECQKKLGGTFQASGEALNRFVSLASDGRDDTYWWSQETPEPGAAWVALAVGLRGMVRCVRLLQSPDPDFAATAVQLQSRPEADWLHVQTFLRVVPGEQQNLHVFAAERGKPAGSMWRVANYDEVPEGLVLVELELYADEYCSKIEVGTHLSPGHRRGQDPAAAFDVRLATSWRAPCAPCARGQAWLGTSFLQLEAGGDVGDVEPRAVDIRCVVVLQGAGGYNTSAASATSSQVLVVERWDGKAFKRVEKFSGVAAGEFTRLRIGAAATGQDPVVVDFGRTAALLAAEGAPEDDAEERRQRFVDARFDAVRATARVFVEAWPAELTSDLETIAKFNAAFSEALRAAFATTMEQPVGNVFADGAELRLPLQGAAAGSEAALASASAQVTAYISQDDGSSNTSAAMWDTDTDAVFAKLKDIAEDPFNTPALFFVDEFKVELRRSTRLEPLLASVVTQVDGEIRFRFENAVLLRVAEPTAATTSPPPSATGDAFAQEITPYVLMLVGIAIGSLFLILMWYRLVYLKRLREEMEMWRVAHPHEPFPRRRAWWRRCLCPKLCPCCWRLAYEDTHQAALFGGGSLSGKSLAIQHQLAAAHKQLAATGGRRT